MSDLTPAQLRELAVSHEHFCACSDGEDLCAACVTATALRAGADAMELKDALLAYFRFVDNSGNWSDSDQQGEHGSAWHISLKEHEELERLERTVVKLISKETSGA